MLLLVMQIPVVERVDIVVGGTTWARCDIRGSSIHRNGVLEVAGMHERM